MHFDGYPLEFLPFQREQKPFGFFSDPKNEKWRVHGSILTDRDFAFTVDSNVLECPKLKSFGGAPLHILPVIKVYT